MATGALTISIQALGADALKKLFATKSALIASVVEQAAPRVGFRHQQTDVHFHLGSKYAGDGYDFLFTADKQSPPHISLAGKYVTAGADWMRLHAPHQWAAMCAARIRGTKEVQIVKEPDKRWGHEWNAYASRLWTLTSG